MESAFATGTRLPAALLHPFSRGTVRLNTTHPAGAAHTGLPLGIQLVDLTLHIIHLRYIRKTIHSLRPSRDSHAIEAAPGLEVQSDEDLEAYVRSTATQLVDLKVHRATGLRIVDAGILPILPSAHLSATIYAVAENIME
ncbi:hypothetical protein MFIFM68171_01977 [Madurella fahalii]|uniref:Glucose-methanol-choline oxidoreductase C-terminal domain-containing protein n=1 Tax=Madurella fahalii TaxID=1157608 RepID=A0ABQ0G1Y1_9PEZI